MDIHVNLPESLLLVLDRVARERGVRRTHLLREAITEYLKWIEWERIEREMQDYAEALADHSAEFVEETDTHTVERLLRDTKW